MLQHTGNAALFNTGFWEIFIFMSCITFIVLLLILIVQQQKPAFFSQAFLGGTTFKILACMVFVFVFLSNNSVNKLVFIGDFFYVYFLNTAFEIYVLLRNLRHKNLR